MAKHELAKLLLGRFSRRRLLRGYIPATAALIGLLLGAAIISFPGGFSFMTNTLSSLGDYRKNPPPGCWFFSAMTFAIGGFLIPLSLYIDRRLREIRRRPAGVGKLLALFAAGAWCVSAIFPDIEDLQITPWFTSEEIHSESATAGFYAIGLAGLAYLYVAVADRLRRGGPRRVLPFGRLIAISLVMYGSMAGLLISEAINDARGISWPGSGLLSWTMWEWLMFFGALFWFAGVAALMPEKPAVSPPQAGRGAPSRP